MTDINPFIRTVISDTNAIYLGVPIEELMENAGKGIAQELIKKYGKSKSFNFICGLGNNGGDGFSAARHLSRLGVENITVYLVGRPSEIKSSAAKQHWNILKESEEVLAGNIIYKSDVSAKDISQADISVECLVGTGIKGKLHKRFHDVVVRLTKQRTKIVAIDVPVPGYTHDLSISLMYPKTAGAKVVDIGMPKEAELFAGPGDVKVLEQPKSKSSKSDNGELLVIGGAEIYHGAPLMALKAASKLVGALYFYTVPDQRVLANEIKAQLDEFILVDDSNLEKFATYANAILIGPGLEDNLVNRSIVKEILKLFPDKPIILDAYAIRFIHDVKSNKNIILTPNRNEIRHIFKDDKRSNKVQLEGKLKRFAIENKCYIVLKGLNDLLFGPDGEYAINKSGNAGMAKAGTGDVLGGIIASFSTKNDLWLSLKAGVFLAGKAGDNLFEEFGPNYSSSDLITEIQKVTKWAGDLGG